MTDPPRPLSPTPIFRPWQPNLANLPISDQQKPQKFRSAHCSDKDRPPTSPMSSPGSLPVLPTPSRSAPPSQPAREPQKRRREDSEDEDVGSRRKVIKGEKGAPAPLTTPPAPFPVLGLRPPSLAIPTPTDLPRPREWRNKLRHAARGLPAGCAARPRPGALGAGSSRLGGNARERCARAVRGFAGVPGPLVPLLDMLVPAAEVERVCARRPRPKRFSCSECGSAFSNKGQLKGHLRIHTGERPFACGHDGCDKRFTRNEELTRHRRIHSGARPFPCPLCDKRFGRKDHLKKHVRTHQLHRRPLRGVFAAREKLFAWSPPVADVCDNSM
ncbi:putative zinc finger, C2H2 type [Penaeus vannamei]|uniref:Putative zinc finger, C2H2 type n=1 Tax=Penaeus vannamei TaxID=6689 RepID=A0A3R7ML05_PENVA|nr:putative zinc finger, C2H2 type [Penaeus vannamei]